jgi:hypothetical protein
MKGAADQIKRKTQVALNNVNTLLNTLGLKDKINTVSRSIKIIPFILTNLPLGVGFPIDDIAIVDLCILLRYLDVGIFEKYITFSHTGKVSVGETINFYTNEEEAERNIHSYLKNPPYVDVYRSLVKEKVIHFPKLDDNEEDAAYVYYTVEFPVPTEVVYG